MHFVKMHGTGNDFIILDNRDNHIPAAEYSSVAARICRRRISLGADGVIVILSPQEGGDYSVLFYNPDGTIAQMCGNGARCAARYGHDQGLAGDIQRIETTAGMIFCQRIEDDLYCVRLNDPSRIDPEIGIPWEGRILSCTYAELGKPGIPHAVVELEDWDLLDREDLTDLGKMIRSWGVFPIGANVTFWKKLDSDRYKVITYERGVEEFTLSCGTGAGSTAVALYLRRLLGGGTVTLEYPGGELLVSLTEDEGKITDIYLTGPAEYVAQGEVF